MGASPWVMGCRKFVNKLQTLTLSDYFISIVLIVKQLYIENLCQTKPFLKQGVINQWEYCTLPVLLIKKKYDVFKYNSDILYLILCINYCNVSMSQNITGVSILQLEKGIGQNLNKIGVGGKNGPRIRYSRKKEGMKNRAQEKYISDRSR